MKKIVGKGNFYQFIMISDSDIDTLVGSKTSLQRSFQKSRRSSTVNGTKYSRSGKV